MSIIVNSDIFRHIHVLFKHIQPYCGIFRIQDKFRSLSRHILAYSERCVTLAYIVRTPPFFFLKEGGVNFDYLPWRRGESEKLKKKGGNMVQGQVLLKEGADTFPI